MPTVYPSIVIGEENSVHVLFDVFINEDYDLSAHYGVKKGAIWSFEEIFSPESEKYSTQSGVHALALDHNGDPHVAITSNLHAYYADKKSGNWIAVRLGEHASGKMGIAVDSDDSVHISIPVSSVGICYATNKTGEWNVISIPGTTDIVKWDYNCPIALDLEDNVHITYGNRKTLYYVTNVTGEWVTNKFNRKITYTDILVDSNDYVHVVYSEEANTEPGLGYATNKNGQWEFENISVEPEGVGSLVLELDADLDPEGNVSVFYQSYWSPNRIYVATNESGNWETERVDNLGGYFFSMALDSLRVYHMVAYSYDEAYYATNASGKWAIEELEPWK